MKKYCKENFIPIMVGIGIACGTNIIISAVCDLIIKIVMVIHDK